MLPFRPHNSAHILEPPQANPMVGKMKGGGGRAKPPIVLRRLHVNLTICDKACFIPVAVKKLSERKNVTGHHVYSFSNK